jgi:hypothetical protein
VGQRVSHALERKDGWKPMPPYKVSLQATKIPCAGTTAFYFEKPKGFEFGAYQFANFALLSPDGSDLKGSTRALSIASAPYEKKSHGGDAFAHHSF